MTPPSSGPLRIGYLGPHGTFTEAALLTQADLVDQDLRPLPTIPSVLTAAEKGDIDLGFVAIENAIEGTVTVTQDTLALDSPLLIQREVVMDIRLDLFGPPGMALDEVTQVASFPHATAQCRRFLAGTLPDAELVAVNSTAEAARLIGQERPAGMAAVAPPQAGELYGLEAIETDLGDHPDNQTRFVLLSPDGFPEPSGHDKTTVVLFQHADQPGSLLAMLQEFAARAINLTKLESRPNRRGLGDYHFVVDVEGHIADEKIADCLRTLKASIADVKFLGSYPAAGDDDGHRRAAVDARWDDAGRWLGELRDRMR